MANSPDPPTVLVIDDSPEMQQILHYTLTRSGYQVLQAADGEKGVALYRDHHEVVGLVLLDVKMPRMSGVATLTELRKINPSVRCLLITANESADEVTQADVSGVMAKPFGLASLLVALARAGLPSTHSMIARSN
jgi:DNA-binding response OmpR family regulator